MPTGIYDRKNTNYPTKEEILEKLKTGGQNQTITIGKFIAIMVGRNYVWMKCIKKKTTMIQIGTLKTTSYELALQLGNELTNLFEKGASFDFMRDFIKNARKQDEEQRANSSEEANKYLNSYMRAIAWLVVHTPMDFLFDKNSIPPREVELICDSLQCDYDALCDDLRMAGAKPNDENNPWQ